MVIYFVSPNEESEMTQGYPSYFSNYQQRNNIHLTHATFATL